MNPQYLNDQRLQAYDYWLRFNQAGSLICSYTWNGSGQAQSFDVPAPLLGETVAAGLPLAGGLPPHLGSAAPVAATPRIYLPLVLRQTSLGPDGTGPLPPGSGITPVVPPPPTVSVPATTGTMGNANFDAGRNGAWTEFSSRGFAVIMQGPDGYKPRSGQYLAWLGGANNDVSKLAQTFTVPASHPFLSLYLMTYSDEVKCFYDRATFLIDDQTVAYANLCREYNFYPWVRGYVNLDGFAGKQITFSVRVETDGTLPSSLFLDDLTFESGVVQSAVTPSPTPSPTPTPPPGNGSLRNPSFELGDNGDWGTGSAAGNTNIVKVTGAHSGSWVAWLGLLQNEDGYIEQTVFIPNDKPYLTYWGWVVSGRDCLRWRLREVPGRQRGLGRLQPLQAE